MIKIDGLRIALVGGGGFIGHNLALELNRLGASVGIFDSLQVNNLYSLGLPNEAHINSDLYVRIINQRLDLLRQAEVPLYLQDARDYHALSRLLTEFNPQVIIHLAAVSHANKSNKDPYSTFDHSLRTLENALDIARNLVPHFIYFSSSLVYGDFPDGMVTEDTRCDPKGIYGTLKYCGERIIMAYNQVFDLSYTIIRPSALYGERCISRRVSQIFLENATQGKGITIHGDGSEALDFTYIRDLLNGVVKIIENKNSRNQTFNLTYGQARTVGEMADILKESFPGIDIDYSPRDHLMPKRGTLSIEKARKLIGYEPEYPLEKGYARYIDWYKDLMSNSEENSRVVATL